MRRLAMGSTPSANSSSVTAPSRAVVPRGPIRQNVEPSRLSTVAQTQVMGHSSSRPSANTTCRDPIGRAPRASTTSSGNVVYVAPVSTIAETRRLRAGWLTFPTVRSTLNVLIVDIRLPRGALPNKCAINQTAPRRRLLLKRAEHPGHLFVLFHQA